MNSQALDIISLPAKEPPDTAKVAEGNYHGIGLIFRMTNAMVDCSFDLIFINGGLFVSLCRKQTTTLIVIVFLKWPKVF